MKWRTFLVALFFISTACCRKDASSPNSQLMPSSGAFNLSNDELIKLKKMAKGGDDNASHRVANYYAYVAHDRLAAIQWLKMPAEKGDVRAMNSLYLYYANGGTEADCQQATYWLDKALAIAQEEYITEAYLREGRERLHWDGMSCNH